MRSKVILLILLFMAAGIGAWSCSKKDHPGKMATLTIGLIPLEQNALLYVADQKKFFADNGLHIVIQVLPHGGDGD